ncbi:hypothetical protein ACTO5A_23215 [Pseudomonas aeruginosa]|nr:hypothetical protein [Pseudomonas aeruginosa]KSC76928.1 hypothetical protein AO888_02945 [Pseudomonas aeruginosa]HCA5884923.1 hypothetical protein [Pseudomonas aeruginosa]HCA6578186.1 hypothetical protein [Pseudomonas aeruginosa]HCA6932472.1 hypothetical protein [Pseudomonas aeruginosa]HCA7561290.1 hypothetical protein [Pseudomonas aeruginosa]
MSPSPNLVAFYFTVMLMAVLILFFGFQYKSAMGVVIGLAFLPVNAFMFMRSFMLCMRAFLQEPRSKS